MTKTPVKLINCPEMKRLRQEGHGATSLRLLLLPSGPGRVGRRPLAWFLAGASTGYTVFIILSILRSGARTGREEIRTPDIHGVNVAL